MMTPNCINCSNVIIPVVVILQEKAEGLTPNEMMDRDRAYIPQLQVQFIDSVALPVYRYVLNNNIIDRFPVLYKVY